jgi:hypothetical protein
MKEDMRDMGTDMLKDIHEFTGGVGAQFATDLFAKVGQAVEAYLTTNIQPEIHKAVNGTIPRLIGHKEGIRSIPQGDGDVNGNGYRYRMENELVPPGTCLHLYRTATGFEAAYTPCTFFDEIEYVPHMVEDHLIKTGYGFALLSLLRQQTQDYNAAFDNELVGTTKQESP